MPTITPRHLAVLGLLALAALPVAGCRVQAGSRVVAVGDSNTCGNAAGCGPASDTWLSRMSLPVLWGTDNRGVPGLAAKDATSQVDAVLAAYPCGGTVSAAPRVKVVIALGTNDLALPGANGPGVGLAVLAVYDRLRAAPCLDVYVATIPPWLGANDAIRTAANAMIQLRVPADHLIRFGDESVSDLLPGGIHINAEGRQRRADMARAVLFPG